MIQLNTIGPISVRIGDHVVPANSELIVASLLFLVAERGKAISRRTFTDLFFPDATGRAAAHSGRQLVYRLRDLGAPVEGDQRTIRLANDSAVWDLEVLLARGRPTESELVSLQRGYLTGAALRQSEPFTRWLDEHRDNATVKLRQMLIGLIQNTRAKKDYRGLDGIARACLALDPLNEEATFAAAESLAVVGARPEAMQLLADYMEDVGSRSKGLRVAASMLRERISAYVCESEREQIALVGRAEELSTLISRIEHSAGNSSQVCFIFGPGGIGKTRLVDEACSIAALSGHAVAHVRLSRHDIERPFAILRDLGPTLLELPGAIGAAPEALAAVRGLCGRGPSPYSRRPANAYDARAVAADITRKVVDLVEAVTEEQPLIIRIEDADRLDEASLELIEQLLDGGRRIGILMASRGRMAFMDRFTASAAATQIPLSALGPEDSVFVLRNLFTQNARPVDSTFVDNAVRISAGVPLFLHALFRNFLATEDPKALPSTLADSLTARLDQLEEPAKSVFDAVVALNTLSTVDRIEEITELPRYSLMQALRMLEEKGFLRFGDGVVMPSHELLADASRRRIPPTVKSLIHRTIALSLERQDSAGLDPLAIACHWEACHEDARALQVVLRSARSSTALGQPRQAIALLQRASGLGSTLAEKRAIDTALLEACHAAGEDCMGVATAEKIGALSGEGSLETQLMGIEVCAQAGKALLPFRVYLEPVAADRTLRSSLRSRAARLLMMIADDLGDARLGATTLTSLSDIDDVSIELIIPRLIFETVFGQPERAVGLAAELREAVLQADTVGMRLQGMWTATLALNRCGEAVRASEVASEAYELAKANAVWSACSNFASMIAEVHWNHDNRPLAHEWFERAGEMLSRPGGTDRAYQYFGLGVSMALGRNDPAAALALLNEAERLFPEMMQQRRSIDFLAHRVAVHLGLGNSPSQQELDELMRGHLERRSLGFHDFIADVLVSALRHAGRFDEARTIRDNYVGRHRKEGSQIASAYTNLIN